MRFVRWLFLSAAAAGLFIACGPGGTGPAAVASEGKKAIPVRVQEVKTQSFASYLVPGRKALICLCLSELR